MSEVQTTDEKTPPCPLCSSLTKLKELWELEDHFHKFFKCVECAVELPVILKREPARGKNGLQPRPFLQR